MPFVVIVILYLHKKKTKQKNENKNKNKKKKKKKNETCIIRLNIVVIFQIFLPILIAQLYISDNVYVYYPVLVLAGFSISVALLLPW